MRRITGVIILLLYLTVSTEFHELFKVPVLFTHYWEHTSKTQGLSLSKFITLHYFGDDGDDSDESTDQQLPFKSTKYAEIFVLESTEAETIYEFGNESYQSKSAPITYANSFISSAHRFCIWQPPRI